VSVAGSYRVAVGSQQADLPISPLTAALAITLMMTIDMGSSSPSPRAPSSPG
jgi:hypothetical protein